MRTLGAVIFQFFADDATAAEAGRLRSVAKARAEMIFDIGDLVG